MSDKSAAELERDAETERAKVAETAESLRSKMTPGQIIDELTGYLRNSDGSIALHNLKTQVRDNPLPLAMIGSGLAWLFLGGGPTAQDMRGAATNTSDESRSGLSSDEVWKGGPGGVGSAGSSPADGKAGAHQDKGIMSSVADKAGSATSQASDAAAAVKSSVKGAASSAAHGVGDAQRSAAESARHVSEQTQHAAASLQKMLADLHRQEPLIIGALGVAVGAAIGAMIPRTEFEDKHVGPYRDQLRESAGDKVQEVAEGAKAVASNTYEAAKKEADRQGLLPEDGKTATEKVSEDVKTAKHTAERSAQDKSAASKQ